MSGVLAIETATDACSVAVYRAGEYHERHTVAPRQHSRLLFSMLAELLSAGSLAEQGIEFIAYGCGPGSFTGLRIAASAVQGLAYSSSLPVVAVSTLAVMAQTALRQGVVSVSDTVLCTLDARINEVYSAVYVFENDIAVLRDGPWACAPGELTPPGAGPLHVVGSGSVFSATFPPVLQARIQKVFPDIVPAARDIIPLSLEKYRRGDTQAPRDVQPVYVRDEISWKKLADQGKRA
ncbi:MAG: tRNA (adenosine(37)-N6)-threonylcarbamoyltransferase complex dimerization subunit type 1 TsaB [Halioglobus sp.]|nr:tRNA (adenosine(37)-N6)-threonylcarbamoyltransferase complex dimerization subunit type 1 TsaB [Halioglobus sp.]